MSTPHPDLPPELAGWQWTAAPGGDVALTHPHGHYTTRGYTQPSRAISAALRWQGSRQQAPAAQAPAVPRVPEDLPAWRWEVEAMGEGHRMRLVNAVEGWATQWHLPLTADLAIDEARAIQGRDAAAVAADTLSPEMRAYAEDVLGQAREFVGRAQAAQQAANELGAGEIRRGRGVRLSMTATAVAYAPGPDADGVFRRPPEMPERIMADPRTLVDGRWQPRKAYRTSSMVELEESVREHGVQEELLAVVNEGGAIELITGHRRKRAAIAVGCPEVPVKILEVTARQARELAIISNDQREDLTDVERGQAYEEAIAELGISEVELAKRLGKPRTYVQQRRAVARATAEVQDALSAGEISFTQARGVCEGSGGDPEAQRVALAEIERERKHGRVVSGESAKQTAERKVREQTAEAIKKLGWQHAEWWAPASGGGPVRHFFFAPTARPAEWSSGDLLAVVREGRRPPAGPGPAPLAGEDRAALEAHGWEVSDRCKPWALARKGKELIAGDAGDLATQIAQARADLAKVLARFEAAGWTAEWKGSTLRATPPADEGKGGKGKGKAKKTQPVEASGHSEAKKLIEKIEKGEWTPETPLSRGYHSSWDCARCKTRTSNMRWLEGAYYCTTCVPIIQAEHAALKAKLAAAVEGHLGAWLDSAPPAAMALLLLQGGSAVVSVPEPGAELRRIFGDWLWRHRDRFKLVEEPPAPAPATAVAAPTPRPLAEILAALGDVEERWAAGKADAADRALLEGLSNQLDEFSPADLPEEQYAALIARIGALLARIDEEGMPS